MALHQRWQTRFLEQPAADTQLKIRGCQTVLIAVEMILVLPCFGRHVKRSAGEADAHEPLRALPLDKTEVGDADVLFGEEDVLRLDVAMEYLLAVKIIDCFCCLAKILKQLRQWDAWLAFAP